MYEYDGFAALELLKNRFELRISQIRAKVIGEKPDPGQSQVVKRAFDLREGRIHIRHRQDRERVEAAGMLHTHLLGKIIALPSERRGLFAIIHSDSWIGNRSHGRVNPIAIHCGE